MKNNHPSIFSLLFILLSIQQVHAQKDSLLLKIYFSEGKFGLSPAAKTLLKDFAVQHKNQSHINIVGRGDRHGSDALNDSLSLKRALAVKSFFNGQRLRSRKHSCHHWLWSSQSCRTNAALY